MGADRTCLFIFGPHRSRTSAVTRTINLLGASLQGDLIGPAATNRRGHWEQAAVVDLNDAILATLGETWSHWGALSLETMDRPGLAELVDQARQVLDEALGQSGLSVTKDPRLCLTGAVWLQAAADLGVTSKAVLTVRNPWQVARSLQRRDNLGLTRGLMIWLRYVIEAERATRPAPRYFLHTDRLLVDWRSVLADAGKVLDIDWPAWNAETEAAIDGFLERPEEKDADAAEATDTPAIVDRTWSCLADIVETGETRDHRLAFDGIRGDFGGAFGMLNQFLQEERESWEQISRLGRKRLKSERDKYRHALVDAQLERDLLAEKLDQISAGQPPPTHYRLTPSPNWRHLDQQYPSTDRPDRGFGVVMSMDDKRDDAFSEFETVPSRVMTGPGQAAVDERPRPPEPRNDDRRPDADDHESVQLLRGLLDDRSAEVDRLTDMLRQHNGQIAEISDHSGELQSTVVRLEALLAEREGDLASLLRRVQVSEDASSAFAIECEKLRLSLGQANITSSHLRDKLSALGADAATRSRSYNAAIASARSDVEALKAKLSETALLLERTHAERLRIKLQAWDQKVARDRKISNVSRELDRTKAEGLYAGQRLDRQHQLIASYEQRLKEMSRGGWSVRGKLFGRYLKRLTSPPAVSKDAVRRISESGLFDANWYERTYPLARASHLDPVQHYLVEGGRLGFAPNPFFDPDWYVSANGLSDLPAEGALRHYIDSGAANGLSPHWLFDPAWLQGRAPKAAAASNPLRAYLDQDDDGSSPHPCFDPAWYREAYPDVGASRINPAVHFVTHGLDEGRSPTRKLDKAGIERLANSPLFDVAAYRRNLAGRPFGRLSAAQHYVFWGAPRGVKPHPLFDGAWYLQQNADVAANGDNPLIHFLEFGAREGRAPHPAFDPSWYLSQNPDVATAGDNPAEHFVQYGWIENRSPNSSVTGTFNAASPDLHPDLMEFLRLQAERIDVGS